MAKYVALLRGINVGGRKIRMNDLRTCLETLGFKDAVTYLQTGNVVFESRDEGLSRIKDMVEAGLLSRFDFVIKVQILSIDKLRSIIAGSPFKESSDYHSYVVFLEGSLAEDLMAQAAILPNNNESIELGNGVIYWRVRVGMTLKSAFAKQLTKIKYKDYNTNRNIKTLKKIVDET